MNDRELLTGIGRGDVKSFESLMDRYSRYVTAVAVRVAGDSLAYQDIEELISDVFIKIWQNSTQITLEADTLKPYLAKAAKNMTLNRLRQIPAQRALPFDESIELENGGSDTGTDRFESREAIYAAVNTLKEPDRELFIRRYFHFEQLHSLARRFRLNRNTVATKLARSRKKLGKALKEGEELS